METLTVKEGTLLDTKRVNAREEAKACVSNSTQSRRHHDVRSLRVAMQSKG